MSLMPTAPRSIGGVLDNAIRLYRAVLPKCIPLVLITVVVLAALGAAMAWRFLNVQTGNPLLALQLFRSPAVWGGYLGILVVSVLVYNTIFVIADTVARGERPSLSSALGAGLKRLVPAIFLSVIFLVMVFVGTIFLLLPGIWAWGTFQFAFAVLIVEQAGVFDSLGTSFRLVKGNWWRATTIMTVGFIIMYVLLMVVGIGVGMLSASLRLSLLGTVITQQILTAILNLFMLPFMPTLLLSIYYDLKLRNEGSDLAARLQALKATV